MTTSQKVIKYVAIAFAIFLIVAIIGGIINVIYNVGDAIFGESPKMEKYEYLIEKSNSIEEAEELIIETKATNVKIIQSEEFNIQTNNKNITYNLIDEKLVIKDKKKKKFNIHSIDTELIIEIPKEHQFKTLEVETGAGKINIEDLTIANLDIEHGAGTLYLKNIETTKKTKIEGGAGKITIDDSILNNLSLELGTGTFKYTGTIIGSSNIECGVGETTINLNAPKEDYQLHLEKGIGSITVGNKTVSNDTTIGDGDNEISIEGGIGSININFEEIVD